MNDHSFGWPDNHGAGGSFEIGDRVEIQRGALRGLTATVTQRLTDGQRYALVTDVLANGVRIVIKGDMLELTEMQSAG